MPHFEPSDIEIKRGGTSYTIDTIKALRQTYPGAELYFITGLDTFLEIQTWHEWETLLTLCCFVVLSRPGYRFADMMKIDFMRSAEKELTAPGPGRNEARSDQVRRVYRRPGDGPAVRHIIDRHPREGQRGQKYQISLA